MDPSAPAFLPFLVEESWMNFDNYVLEQLSEQDLLEDLLLVCSSPSSSPQLNTPTHTPAYNENDVEVRTKTVEEGDAPSSLPVPPPFGHGVAPAPDFQSVGHLPPPPPLTINLASVKEEHPPPPPMNIEAGWMSMDLGPDFVNQVTTRLQQGAVLLDFRSQMDEVSGQKKEKEMVPPKPQTQPPKNTNPENPLGLKLHQLDPKSIKNPKFRNRVKSAIQSRKYREDQKRLAEAPKCLGLCNSGPDLLNQLKALQAKLESQPRPENFEWREKVRSIVGWLEGKMT